MSQRVPMTPEGFQRLQEFFYNEFSSDGEKTAEYLVHKNIKAFIDDAILSPHPTLPDTYNLTSEGFRKLKCFAGFLAPFLESYLVVLMYFRDTANPPEDGAARLKQILHLGGKFYKRQEVVRQEAVSKINYLNAVDFYLKGGIRKGENGMTLATAIEAIQTYIKHLPL